MSASFQVGQVLDPFKKQGFFQTTVHGHKDIPGSWDAPVIIEHLIKIRVLEINAEKRAGIWIRIRVWDYNGIDHDIWVEEAHLEYVLQGPPTPVLAEQETIPPPPASVDTASIQPAECSGDWEDDSGVSFESGFGSSWSNENNYD